MAPRLWPMYASTTSAGDNNTTTPPSVLAMFGVAFAVLVGVAGLLCFALWLRRRNDRANMVGGRIGYPGAGTDAEAVPHPAGVAPQTEGANVYHGVTSEPGVGAVPDRQWYTSGAGLYQEVDLKPGVHAAPGVTAVPGRQWYRSGVGSCPDVEVAAGR